MPDQSHVGRRYEALAQKIEPEAVAAFAQAIAGADPVFDASSIPPTFAAVYCLYPTLGQLLMDDEVGIDLAGLIHGEQVFEWPNPLRAGDSVDASCRIAGVAEKRGLTFVDIECEAHRASDGVTVCRGTSKMIIRDGS